MADERGGMDTAGYLGWFFLGAVAGAATALLLAPKTGAETRELLAEQGGQILNRAKAHAGDAREKAGDLFERGREYLEEQSNRLISAFEAGRAAMRDEISQGRPGL